MKQEIISAFDSLPNFGVVLTADNKELSIARDLQKRIAVINLLPEEKKHVAILHVASASRFEIITIKGACEKAGYTVKSELQIEGNLLVDVYAGQHKRAENDGEDWVPEDDDFFRRFDEWAAAGVKAQASDIHIEIREEKTRIRLRINGQLYTHSWSDSMLAVKTVMAAYTFLADPLTRSSELFDKTDERNCMIARIIDDKPWRFRFESYPVLGGLDCTMRIISVEADEKIPTLRELGFAPSQVKDLITMIQSKGLIVLCGTPGAGKSTTAMSLIDAYPDKETKKIISIEDPVERRNADISQISVQRRGGRKSNSVNDDTAAFSEAARTLLRGDLDMSFIGEIRGVDVGSITTFLTQAGSKVIATLHAGSALDAVPRMASDQIGMSRQALGGRNFIGGLVYQVLLPLLCDNCKRLAAGVLDQKYLDLIQEEFEVETSDIRVIGPGCPDCNGRGIKGRIVAAETVRLDDFMRKCIRHGLDAETEDYWMKRREVGFEEENMAGKTAFEHGLYSVLKGLVDPRHLEQEFEPFYTYRLRKSELYSSDAVSPKSFPRAVEK